MILWWKNSKPPHRPRDCRQIIVSYDNWEIVISIFYSSTRAGRWRRKRKNEFIWRVDYKYIEVNECTAPSLARQPLTKPWARMYSYETNFAMNFSSCLLAFVIHKKKCNYGLLCEYLPSQCCTVMFQHLRASRMVGAKSAPHSSNTRNQYCRDRQGNVTKLSTTLHTSFFKYRGRHQRCGCTYLYIIFWFGSWNLSQFRSGSRPHFGSGFKPFQISHSYMINFGKNSTRFRIKKTIIIFENPAYK